MNWCEETVQGVEAKTGSVENFFPFQSIFYFTEKDTRTNVDSLICSLMTGMEELLQLYILSDLTPEAQIV